ncbi:hypothetical protein OAP56_01960 [Rickettsiaceae bacterium]|nr:hypothetical protein [Rickettsiaceae bacterium]
MAYSYIDKDKNKGNREYSSLNSELIEDFARNNPDVTKIVIMDSYEDYNSDCSDLDIDISPEDYEKEMEEFVNELENSLKKVTHVYADQIRLNDKSIELLAEVLLKTQVKYLDISWNNITDFGLKILANIIDKTKIKVLGIANNKISADELQSFKKKFSTTKRKITFLTEYEELPNEEEQQQGNKQKLLGKRSIGTDTYDLEQKFGQFQYKGICDKSVGDKVSARDLQGENPDQE